MILASTDSSREFAIFLRYNGGNRRWLLCFSAFLFCGALHSGSLSVVVGSGVFWDTFGIFSGALLFPLEILHAPLLLHLFVCRDRVDSRNRR